MLPGGMVMANTCAILTIPLITRMHAGISPVAKRLLSGGATSYEIFFPWSQNTALVSFSLRSFWIQIQLLHLLYLCSYFLRIPDQGSDLEIQNVFNYLTRYPAGGPGYHHPAHWQYPSCALEPTSAELGDRGQGVCEAGIFQCRG